MRKTITVIAFMVFACLAVPNIEAEEVISKESFFLIKFSDGAVEHYLVRWSGHARTDMREDGHPAVPAKGWFTDTRQCHWTVNGSITREVWLMSRSGRRFRADDFQKIYEKGKHNKGSDFVVIKLRSENCGDARTRRESDHNDMKNRVRADFPGTVVADLEQVKKDFKSDLEAVVEVEEIK